jgi:hypothetical protein
LSWFTKKCPIHQVELKIGKNYMCDLFYYCPICRKEKQNKKQTAKALQSLEARIKVLEKARGVDSDCK